MAERDVSLAPVMTEGQPQPDSRSPIVKPVSVGLPAGIRWWEACGGWTARYALGTL